MLRISILNCRKTILEYFGEDTSHLEMRSNCCDNCARGVSNYTVSDLYVGIDEQGLYDFTRDAETLINSIKCMEMNKIDPTRKRISNLLLGKYDKALMNLPQHGIGRGKPFYFWCALMDQLMFNDYIDFVAGQAHLTLTKIGESWRVQGAPKTLKLKPIGAIYKFIKRKPSTPFAISESSQQGYEWRPYERSYSRRSSNRSYGMYTSSTHDHLMDLFFGDCVYCG